MKCPKCDIEMKCPCIECHERKLSKPGEFLIMDFDTGIRTCGNCGDTKNMGWFEPQGMEYNQEYDVPAPAGDHSAERTAQ